MPSIGLRDIQSDTLIYYIDEHYVVMKNPLNGNCPAIVKRTFGDPDVSKINSILHKLNFSLDDEPSYRGDGLWFCKLKANGETYDK